MTEVGKVRERKSLLEHCEVMIMRACESRESKHRESDEIPSAGAWSWHFHDSRLQNMPLIHLVFSDCDHRIYDHEALQSDVVPTRSGGIPTEYDIHLVAGPKILKLRHDIKEGRQFSGRNVQRELQLECGEVGTRRADMRKPVTVNLNASR
jgi:hypothetical protein